MTDHDLPNGMAAGGTALTLLGLVEPTGFASVAGPIMTLAGGIVSVVFYALNHAKERAIDRKLKLLDAAEAREKKRKRGIFDGRLVYPPDIMPDT